MLIVSYYTPNYATFAATLRASCETFCLRHWIAPIPSVGSWVENCAIKAQFVRNALVATDDDILWLDADARIERDLDLIHETGADFAIYQEQACPKLRFRSGTVYFANTPPALALVDEWAARCQTDPQTWDQEHLYRAWEGLQDEIATRWLPMSYCQRFDENPGVADPHIVHYQASRHTRKVERKRV